jgi:hypothetical protein
LKDAPLLNTITQGTDIIDNVKKNIFPLAHINIQSSTMQAGQVIFVFEVAIVDIRNVSKLQTVDKFLGNDYEIDNLNTTHGIMNYFVTKIKMKRNDDDIEVEEVAQLEPILLDFTNMLDGWKTTITLSIPNNEISVCCE